jgi:hypothetical protein
MARTKKNHYKINSVCTCDECNKEPENKILWQDKYRYLWCINCWDKIYN